MSSANTNDSLFGETRDPEEIRKEIAETTADLTETLAAIQNKLQPEAIVAEAKEEVVDQALSLVTKVRRHPAAMALVGVGAAVVIGRAIAGSRSGSTFLTLAIGAVIGASAYRVLAGDRLREEDELDATMTQEINPAAEHSVRVALE